jgi:hypothetical protein
MDRDVQIWLIVLAAATALSVMIQVGSLVGLYLGIRRLRAKIETICAAATKGPSLPEIATNAREALESANRAARNTAEIIERIKPLVNETSILCHGQMARANQVFSDFLTRVETISQQGERSVHEFQALFSGLRSAFAVLFERPPGSKTRNRQSGSHHTWIIFLLILNLPACFAAWLSAQQAEPGVSYEGERVAIVDLVARPSVDLQQLRPLILQKADWNNSSHAVLLHFSRHTSSSRARAHGLGCALGSRWSLRLDQRRLHKVFA